jgi:cysteine desulfuration protein SufE
LVEDLAIIEDPQERLALIVDRARRFPPLPAADRTEANRVPGCVSVVWLACELRDGRCMYRADADSPLVRGLVTLLAEFFSGFTPADLLSAEVDPLEALGLIHNLSPTRRNGLNAVRAAIRAYARTKLSAPASPP